jgi:hypothetical protein
MHFFKLLSFGFGHLVKRGLKLLVGFAFMASDFFATAQQSN